MAAGQSLVFDRAAASSYMRERAASIYLVDDTVVICLAVGWVHGLAFRGRYATQEKYLVFW